MTKQSPDEPKMEPLTRVQVLAAMGLTAVVLLFIAKIWLLLDSVVLLPIDWRGLALPLGVGLGVGITIASGIVYRLWEAYRKSADFYLTFILKPLVWTDLIWLGLLPGLSEELLFRGVMLPALGLNMTGVLVSSLCFGVLHLSGAEQWPYVVWATVVGFLLGFSALETGNLLVPIVAHVTTNFISSCMWKVDNK